jgi:serine/threonine protein kinase
MVAELSRVGPYAVLRPLGAGGMAETFVAERRGPGAFVQRVCLKRIRTDMAKDPELVRQFMAEAAIAARLRHATIASVLDFGEDGGVLYMAIELIDGVDLRELIHHAPAGLPSTLLVYIAVELCTALDVAHGSSVVHRDVSPSNVLISTEGEVKLADFGIARAETTPSHTRTGIVRGKVPYMAPEYARTGRFDARADLFSLGVLLHECAYGDRPFDGATDLETLERATRGERCPLRERDEPVPAGFESILSHLLHPEPDQRFATASAALEALLSLPSDPRARRELGARVSGLRPAHNQDPSFASTSLAAVSPLAGSNQVTRTLESSELAVPRRKLGPVVAVIAAALALGVALVLWTRTLDASKTRSAAPLGAPATAAPDAPAPAPLAQPANEPVLRPVAAERARAADVGDDRIAGPAQDSSRLARLEVVVVPFGDVYVNERLITGSPPTVKLPAGTYEIRAEPSTGTVRRRVELHAGERKRIEIR